MGKENDLNNHGNQLNPNNDTYWQSRGWDERPDDWEERLDGKEKAPAQDQGKDRTRQTT